MKGSPAVHDRTASSWVTGLALLAWLAWVAVWGHRAKLRAESLPLWSVHTRSALLDLGWDFVAALLTRTLFFLPIAFLATLLLASRAAARPHPLRTGLLGASLSCLVALGLLAAGCWPAVAPLGLYNLMLPLMGILMGTAAALVWKRGPLARRLLLIGVSVGTFVLLTISVWVVSLMIEPEPMLLQAPTITAEEKRQIYDLFSEKNPLKIEKGKTERIVLKEHDLNVLLALGLSVGHAVRIASVEIEGNRATLRATSPISSRFLNVTAQGSVRVAAGRLQLQVARLRVGRVELPRSLLRLLSPLVARVTGEDARVKPVLNLLRTLDLDAGTLKMTYGHGRLPEGFIAGLFHDSSSRALDIPAIKAHVRNLMASVRSMPSDHEARFGSAVETAFRFARQRSTPGRAVIENRSALLALAILLGHPGVEALIGNFMEDSERAAATRAFEGTTLRQRDDWPKHFFVSAALTIVAAGRLSNVTGLFKEEKDSGGGTGFSFGDLLADRAGTTFAEFATHSETSARALQARLARGFEVDDYIPSADGLPEHLQDAEFRERYGGVGGKGYLLIKAEIERRIGNCAAYKDT